MKLLPFPITKCCNSMCPMILLCARYTDMADENEIAQYFDVVDKETCRYFIPVRDEEELDDK
jgi:hypothetical protein